MLGLPKYAKAARACVAIALFFVAHNNLLLTTSTSFKIPLLPLSGLCVTCCKTCLEVCQYGFFNSDDTDDKYSSCYKQYKVSSRPEESLIELVALQ